MCVRFLSLDGNLNDRETRVSPRQITNSSMYIQIAVDLKEVGKVLPLHTKRRIIFALQ